MLTQAGFLLFDYSQFTLPVSIAILIAVFGISVAQAVAIGNKRYFVSTK